MEGAEILWEQSHTWDETKVLSSCTGRGDAVIAPGRFYMFKPPPKVFPGIEVTLSLSPSHVPSSSLQHQQSQFQKNHGKLLLPLLLVAPGLIPIQQKDAGNGSPGSNLNSPPASINKSLGNATMVWMDHPQRPASDFVQ